MGLFTEEMVQQQEDQNQGIIDLFEGNTTIENWVEAEEGLLVEDELGDEFLLTVEEDGGEYEVTITNIADEATITQTVDEYDTMYSWAVKAQQ